MTEYSKRHSGPGFTLIELLVVIAVILLLAVLMIPSLRDMYRVARTTTCANNLNRIGQAVTSFSGSGPGGQQMKISPQRWPVQLADYIGGDGGIFICPERDGELQTSHPIHLPDLVCINVTTTGYDLELIEGPYVAKVSNEQFQAISFQRGRRINAPKYDAGADPTVCWYLLEGVHYAQLA